MPEMSCLFAVAEPAVLDALAADPTAGPRLHRFAACEGLELGEPGLLVAFLSGAVALPWPAPEAQPAAQPAASELLGSAQAEHPWLQGALPPAEVALRWSALGARHRLAWWWWWERGDDLYADAAWLLGPDGQRLAARETALGASRERSLVYAEGGPPEPGTLAPLQLALLHLGFRSRLQYFVPTDQWRFDWAPHRVGS
jgi:hypothetical protein